MVDQDVNIKALQREWLAARIFAVLVLVALVAVAVQVLFYPPLALTSATSDTAGAEAQRHAAALALCTAALTTTQGFGIVPAYTQLASDMVQGGTVRGRYTCFARTDAAKYQITFDLMCKDLGEAKCLNLYSVTQDGTGTLYQRH
jgi:hypothetical protein